MKYAVISLDIFTVTNIIKIQKNKITFVRLSYKVKLEYNRHAFTFAGAKIYNELQVKIRDGKDFREQLVKYFGWLVFRILLTNFR